MTTRTPGPASAEPTTTITAGPPREPEPRGALASRIRTVDLPLPGRGDTLARWAGLARLTREDIVTGRLVEAHLDAAAITTDLGAPELVEPGSHWGVWAAQPPQPLLTASEGSAGWVLDGTKPWCSGASMCTHALVTATTNPGSPDSPAQIALFAVDLRQSGVRAVPDTWPAVGMAASDSGWVEFESVPARRLGSHADYLDRPGFWHGGVGVAACWFGGARAVAQTLFDRALRPNASPLVQAHAGAAAAELAAGWSLLEHTAAVFDADPHDDRGLLMGRALMVRTRIDRMAAAVIDRVGRALGAGPLCSDGAHAQCVADLSVYIRQTHAEADEATVAAEVRGHAYRTAGRDEGSTPAGESGSGGSVAPVDAVAHWDALIGLDSAPLLSAED